MKKLFISVLCYSIVGIMIASQNLNAIPQIGNYGEIKNGGKSGKENKKSITDYLYESNYDLTQIELTTKFAKKKIKELEEEQARKAGAEGVKPELPELKKLQEAKAHFDTAFNKAKAIREENVKLMSEIKISQAKEASSRKNQAIINTEKSLVNTSKDAKDLEEKFKSNCSEISNLERTSQSMLRILNSM